MQVYKRTTAEFVGAAAMGCKICTGKLTSPSLQNGTQVETNVTKQYSWDNKEKMNPKDFTIENIDNETVGRLPNTINGQQFIIRNCKNAKIYLFDHINTLTIDDCLNCSIVVGPTKGSVFVRDCKECHLIVACQQFRTRDCQRMDIFLLCTTHPIIEMSSQMIFSCYCYSYAELANQFQNAGLSPFNNEWHDVRDFTPVQDKCNWSTMPNDCKVEDYIPMPATEELFPVKVSTDRHLGTIPYTYGIRQRVSKEFSFVVFFNTAQFLQMVHAFLQDMASNHPQIRLIRTKEMKMTISDAQRLFETDKYRAVVENSAAVGMEYNGDKSNEICQRVASIVAPSDASFYVSDVNLAKSRLNRFFDLSDMQM